MTERMDDLLQDEASSLLSHSEDLPSLSESEITDSENEETSEKRKYFPPKTEETAIKKARSLGRPKGSSTKKNVKKALDAKEIIEMVHKGIGGYVTMREWAMKNPSEFYTKIYTKLLPLNVKQEIKTEIKELKNMSETDLLMMLQEVREELKKRYNEITS